MIVKKELQFVFHMSSSIYFEKENKALLVQSLHEYNQPYEKAPPCVLVAAST